jgi:hypothetical protein
MGGTVIQCVDKNILIELAMHRGWIKSEQYELHPYQRKYAVVIPLRYGSKKYVATRSGLIPLSKFRLHDPGEYQCNDNRRLYSWLRDDHDIRKRVWHTDRPNGRLMYVWFPKEHAYILHTSQVFDADKTPGGYLGAPHVITSVADAFRVMADLDSRYVYHDNTRMRYRIE